MDWSQGGYCGIRADGANNSFNHILVVSNYDGIYSGRNAQILNCKAAQNTGYGFRSGSGANISECSSERCINGGIYVGDGSAIANCSMYDSGAHGITAGAGSTVIKCSSVYNDFDGIAVGNGSTVADCSVYDNDRDGIVGAEGVMVSRCTAMRNMSDGIQVSSDAVVKDCVSDSNGYSGDGAGIYVTGDDCRLEDNTVTDCDRGLDIEGVNTYVANNKVHNNTANYAIAAGNQLNILLCEVPEVIAWPASVKLAGDLTASGVLTNGITVAASGVTIDLGGHSLIGPGLTGRSGIAQQAGYDNLLVRNGSVRNWRQPSYAGIELLGYGNTIEKVQILSNALGIKATNGTVITSCMLATNTDYAIRAGFNARISDCTLIDNYTGIRASKGSAITRCVVEGSKSSAIMADDEVTITDNICRDSTGVSFGIYAIGNRNIIRNNELLENNGGLRMEGTGNQVSGNRISGNTVNYGLIGDGNSLDLLLSDAPIDVKWPAKITLTGPIVYTTATTNAITVLSDNVTIDLNGHPLIGGRQDWCGIYQPPNRKNLSIRNGQVIGWGNSWVGGIYLEGMNNLIENVQVYSNYYGIRAENHTLIRQCAAYDNSFGIRAYGGCSVLDSISHTNYYGITCDYGTVSRCTVLFNEYGINSDYATIVDCTASSNRTSGIRGFSSTIIDCTADFNRGWGFDIARGTINNCTARGNLRHGIFAQESFVSGCGFFDNGYASSDGAGIRVFGSGNRIEDNLIFGNDAGILAPNAGNIIIRNTARGNTSNYCFYVGNATGITINVSGGGDITTENPWVNFIY